LFPITGLLALIWFLIRVIPKPSRATYPCQRVVAPLASGFVVWIMGIVGSTLAYRKAREFWVHSRYVVAGVFLAVAVLALWLPLNITDESPAHAAFTPSDPANAPMGTGKGLFPGRVVWVYEPDVARWDGTTGNWWDEQNTDQDAADAMVSRAIRSLTGQATDLEAWDALFRHLNRSRGLDDVGWQQGEKIAVKINMNQDSGGAWSRTAGMPCPQMLHALLDQLIHGVGVPGSDITLYDAARYIGDPIYNKIHNDPDPNFQAVRFVVKPSYARQGRTAAQRDLTLPVVFANKGISYGAKAYLPTCLTEARYLINVALLRPHQMFGITACAKNLFGSLYWSGYDWTPSPLHNYGNRDSAMGTYNCLVDLIGHPHLGGKTLLYLVDGLYGAQHQSGSVMKFTSFNDDWTSSLLASQDPVAIDSVALDILRNEPRCTEVTGRGVDNYLHEAALADSPASKTIYDPDGDGVRLASLGVHEHWSNATSRQYSRNLGRNQGIELWVPSRIDPNGPVQNLSTGIRYDTVGHAVAAAASGDVIVVQPGLYRENVEIRSKDIVLRSTDPNRLDVIEATIIRGSIAGVSVTNNGTAACRLEGLTIAGSGLGLFCDASAPTVSHCRIVDNGSVGIRLSNASHPNVVNCLIAGNAGHGIEMIAFNHPRGGTVHSLAAIASSTVAGNSGWGLFGGLPTVIHSIVYGNGAGPISGPGPIVQYSDIQGTWPGVGNIAADPCFVGLGDYHLQKESLCIDAGDPNTPPVASQVDIDGEPRIMGSRIDIGFDEVSP
jgi:hypothetical protein